MSASTVASAMRAPGSRWLPPSVATLWSVPQPLFVLSYLLMYVQSCVKHYCYVLRITLKMFLYPPQNSTMAQYFSPPFPKPGRNVFTLVTTLYVCCVLACPLTSRSAFISLSLSLSLSLSPFVYLVASHHTDTSVCLPPSSAPLGNLRQPTKTATDDRCSCKVGFALGTLTEEEGLQHQR